MGGCNIWCSYTLDGIWLGGFSNSIKPNINIFNNVFINNHLF